MFDIHTHILPGLDDGSPDISDSIEMAQIAVDSGIQYLVCTPHANQIGRFENFRSPALIRVYRNFQNALKETQIPLKLYLGMEIFASDDLYDKIMDQRLFGLNGGKYYLVEFAFDEAPEAIHDYLEMIFAAGKIPLIAHPERYYCVQDYPVLVYEWLQRGCYTQLNKGSVFGRFGAGAQKVADTLLKNQLITCVATDAHRPYIRTPYMADIRQYLETEFGEAEALRLTWTNPARILGSNTVTPHGQPPQDLRKIFY